MPDGESKCQKAGGWFLHCCELFMIGVEEMMEEEHNMVVEKCLSDKKLRELGS